MAWLLRKFIQFMVIGVILLAITAIALILFINPTHFTGQINKLLQTHTGYQIEVRGPISWSFTPNFSIRLKDVALAGPKEFKSPFFVAKDVKVQMSFFSLFSSNLVINNLEIDQMLAIIQRQASGNRNIDMLQTVKVNPEDRLTINEVTISNSTLLYQNEQANRHWALNNASFQIRTIVFNPTSTFGSIKIKGDWTQLDNNFTFNIDTTLVMDTAKKTGTLDPLTIVWNGAKLQGNTTISQYPEHPIYTGSFAINEFDLSDFINSINPALAVTDAEFAGKGQGKFNYTFDEEEKILDIPSFEFALNEASIKGNTKANFTAPYLWAFDVTVNKINLMPYVNAAQSILPLAIGHMQISDPLEILKTIGVRGKIAGTDIRLMSDFAIDQFSADVGIEKGLIQIGPVMLRALDGGHHFSISIDTNQASPTIKLVEQGNNVQLDPWLKLFNLPRTVTGTAELKIALDGEGLTLDAFKNSASGQVDFSVKSGAFHGLDVIKLQNYTVASLTDIIGQLSSNRTNDLAKLIKVKSADWISSQSNASSPFDLLQFNNQVKSGAATSSLSVTSTVYDFNATGTMALADYKLSLTGPLQNKIAPTGVSADLGKYMQQLPISVTVNGTLANPSFNPDLQTYINKLMSQIQKSLMGVAVGKMVNTTGANAPTDKAAEELFINSLQGVR